MNRVVLLFACVFLTIAFMIGIAAAHPGDGDHAHPGEDYVHEGGVDCSDPANEYNSNCLRGYCRDNNIPDEECVLPDNSTPTAIPTATVSRQPRSPGNGGVDNVQPVATPTATATLMLEVPTFTPTATATLGPVPTFTSTPTATVQAQQRSPSRSVAPATPQQQPTPFPTRPPFAIVQIYCINARSGPGLGYDVVAEFLAGTEGVIVGVDATRDWLLIEVEGHHEQVWVYRNLTAVVGSLATVERVE